MITFLKSKFSQIFKLYYFSDGASTQFKNRKNFINLCKHAKDFDILAECNFFATSHGKGACDGVGGTVKRLAACASLRPYSDQIMTPHQLFEWCSQNIQKNSVQLCHRWRLRGRKNIVEREIQSMSEHSWDSEFSRLHTSVNFNHNVKSSDFFWIWKKH